MISISAAAPRTVTGTTVGRVASAAFAAVTYLAFLGVFGYAVAFVGGFVVPRTVDHGGPTTSLWAALLTDGLLLSIFALQHSVMARPAFKRLWTRIVPTHLERSVYVLIASAVLALTFWQWRPIPYVIWDVRTPVLQVALWTLFGLGWFIVVAMTFAIDHVELFGLRQVWRHLGSRPATASAFRLPWAYRLVRHPMMTGFMIAFLATPRMTAGHLFFAIMSCGYIVVAVRLEERDLAESLPEYPAYATSTPRFIPSPCPHRRRVTAA